jgi:hypothetical protein
MRQIGVPTLTAPLLLRQGWDVTSQFNLAGSISTISTRREKWLSALTNGFTGAFQIGRY